MVILAVVLICFFASTVGAICGIGGGVIIKPALDAFGIMDVSTISFLSGCTVLAMSTYSVVRSKLSGASKIDQKTGLPLALGAAIGGTIGKALFQTVKAMRADPNFVGAVQAACLIVVTIGTLLYTVNKAKISTHRIRSGLACLAIGLCLGVMSSFLGIGGGPINLVVLYFFFSMSSKTAAENSLYIILFSQLTSFLSSVVTGAVPNFPWPMLILMVSGGILGGVAGRMFNRKLDDKMVDKLFIGLMILIILINIYNVYQFM